MTLDYGHSLIAAQFARHFGLYRFLRTFGLMEGGGDRSKQTYVSIHGASVDAGGGFDKLANPGVSRLRIETHHTTTLRDECADREKGDMATYPWCGP